MNWWRRGKKSSVSSARAREYECLERIQIMRVKTVKVEAEILNSSRVIAIVGLSLRPTRPSCKVASYLKKKGYKIVPVNPEVKEMLGEPSYPDLSSIPEPVDVVDIFRRSEEVPAIVEEAIKIGAKAVWMQEGVVNEEAASRAKEAGLLVVMNKCMRKEHLKLSK
jgi:predicted CoA-binding protein